MKKLQMVDLVSQLAPIKDEINNAFTEIMENASFVNGPYVHQFQADLEKYLGVKHVIPCANGTDALQIAMMGLGLKPGDEVITADFTFAATVEVIALLNVAAPASLPSSVSIVMSELLSVPLNIISESFAAASIVILPDDVVMFTAELPEDMLLAAILELV